MPCSFEPFPTSVADPAGGGATDRSAGASTWYAKRLSVRRLLGADALDDLLEASHRAELPRRALLFDPERTGDLVWWIEEGRVRLSRFGGDGREIMAAVLEEGELFGEEPRAPFGVFDAYAEVIESGVFRWVARERFEELLDDHERASQALARHLARQHGLSDGLPWLGGREVRDPIARVATALRAWNEDERAYRLPPLALQEHALLCGLPRPRWLDALAHWIDRGACAVRAGRLHVLDRERLVTEGRSR